MKAIALLFSAVLLGTVASAQLVTVYSAPFLAPGPSGGYWLSSINSNFTNSSFVEQPFVAANAFRPTRVRVRGAFIHDNAASNPASPQSTGFEVWFSGTTGGSANFQNYGYWYFDTNEVAKTLVGVLPFAGFQWSVYDLDLEFSGKAPSLNTTGNPNGTLPSGVLSLGVREIVPASSQVRFGVQTQFSGQSFQSTSSGFVSRNGTSMVIQGVPEPLSLASVSIGLLALAKRRKANRN